MLMKAQDNTLDRLSNAECINAYAEPIQSVRRNVLLVAADDKMPSPNTTAGGNSSDVYAINYFYANQASKSNAAMNSYLWICSALNSLTKEYCSNLVDGIKSASEDWKVGSVSANTLGDPVTFMRNSPLYPVDYCLSEKAEPRCKVQYALPIAILVTVLNLLKSILIFYTALGTKDDPLMTMGDAVASFLEKRDETTKGMCLLSMRNVKENRGYFPTGPRTWRGKQRRLKDVTSRTRRSVTFAM